MFRVIFFLIALLGFAAFIPVFAGIYGFSIWVCEFLWVITMYCIWSVRSGIIEKKRRRIMRQMNTLNNNENFSQAKGEMRLERYANEDHLVWYEDILELPKKN